VLLLLLLLEMMMRTAAVALTKVAAVAPPALYTILVALPVGALPTAVVRAPMPLTLVAQWTALKVSLMAW
jgi:hypothetical protein